MFSIWKMGVGTTAPFVYLPMTAGETIVPGEALKFAVGKLTKAAGTDVPSHVALGPGDERGIVPCVEVRNFLEFQTTLSAAGTALNLGDKVTLSPDGLEVTATTASGVATIKRMSGTAVGDTVCVSF